MQFGVQKLFQDLNWTVRWKERWGVIGSNGVGKSTLLKILMGHMEPASGSYRLGSQIDVGYFAQDAYDIDLELSPLEWISLECGLLAQQARDLLGRFLIHGDDVFRPIRSLSGGERNKLVLAKLTARQPNLLILDEPTNHLDLASREALIEVLKQYEGTLIVVSHDRTLLGEVTRQTLDLRREGACQFPGNYKEYREFRQKGSRGVSEVSSQVRTSPKAGRIASEVTLSPRELSKEIQRVAKLVEQAEQQVTQHELELAEVEKLLTNPESSEDPVSLSYKYSDLRKLLESRMREWETLCCQLEELRELQKIG
jgi:ATP-binding cassette subfamily F protein 3